MPISWYAQFMHPEPDDPNAQKPSAFWLPVVGWDLGDRPAGYVVSPAGTLHPADSRQLAEEVAPAAFDRYTRVEEHHFRWFALTPTPAPAHETPLVVELSTGRRFTGRLVSADDQSGDDQLIEFRLTENGQHKHLKVHPDAIVSVAWDVPEGQSPSG